MESNMTFEQKQKLHRAIDEFGNKKVSTLTKKEIDDFMKMIKGLK